MGACGSTESNALSPIPVNKGNHGVEDPADNGLSKAKIVSGLANFPLFEETMPYQREALAELLGREDLPKNTIVFKEGSRSNCDKMYFLLSGSAVSCSRDANGFFVELKKLNPSDTFGYAGLFKEAHQHRTTIATTEQSIFLTLSRNDFATFKKIVPDAFAQIERNAEEVQLLIETLKHIAIFKHMSAQKQQRFSEIFSLRKIKKGTTILKQGGDSPRKFSVVASGEVDVFIGKEKIRSLGVGDYFGEVSLVSSAPHSATVKVASQDAMVFECGKEDFLNFLVGETATISEISLKVRGLQSTFENVLGHPDGRDFFSKFVAKEFAKENIYFMEDLARFEAINKTRIRKSALRAIGENPDAVVTQKKQLMRSMATDFFEKYISTSAKMEINIAETTASEIQERFQNEDFSFDMFDQAKREVAGMLEGSFTRFQTSPEFNDLLVSLGSYVVRDA